MTERLPASATAMLDAVRDRCRAMSLPAWSADSAGTILAEPTETGLSGLWLRSGKIHNLIAAAAKQWNGPLQPQVIQAFPGCWLIPVVHDRRRRRIAITLAMALGPAAAIDPMFGEACASAGLDRHATTLTLAKLAVFDEAAAKRACSMLQWMVNDLGALTEHADAVQGFTHELTQSYETIDMLYALGRSMLDLNRPARFLSLVCDRLHETLPFGWVACQFVSDPKIVGELAGSVMARGTLSPDSAQLEAAFAKFSGRPSNELRGVITSSNPRSGVQDSRVVAQPITADGKLAGMLLCGDKRGEDPQVSSYDMQLIEAAAGYTGAFLENARLVRDQQAMFMGTLKALTAAIDAKDRYTCGHSERVAHLASKLAESSGLDASIVQRVHICGLVHDVGKIGVPEAVLCKPGRLTDEEFALIKLHPEIGHRILRDIPMLEDVLPGVLSHHERFDGRGYPHGLKGQDIPLFARLICLADTFDAMSSSRSYRAAMPRNQVLAEIVKCAGSQFDPELASRFVSMDFAEYDQLVTRHSMDYGPQRIVSIAA